MENGNSKNWDFEIVSRAAAMAAQNGTRLSDMNRLVFAKILEAADENGELVLSVDGMAEKFGIAKRTVTQGLARLAEAGVITRKPAEHAENHGRRPMKTTIAGEVLRPAGS